MTAIGTLPVLFATGIHSARPAASAVGAGGLYSCTTHSLVYQTDGSSWTTWASLSGTATRASLGLDTTDSPQFAALNVGNASDTTVDRASAGDIEVEGNRIFRVGGTDVPVADGGTGASTASGARTNLGVVPGTDVASLTAGVVPIAQLATGTPTGSKFIRDDGTLQVPSGGSALTVKDEGSNLDTAVTSIDFTGAGVVATAVGHAISVAVAGGGGSGGGSGALIYLGEQVAASSATLDFTGFITSDYDEYVFEFLQIIPATDNDNFIMRMGTGGGPTWDSGSNYNWAQWRYLATTNSPDGANATTGIRLVDGIDTTASVNWSLNGSCRLFAPASAIYKQVTGKFSMFDNGANAFLGTELSGAYLSTTAVTGVRFLMSSGNIASGRVRVYGVAKTVGTGSGGAANGLVLLEKHTASASATLDFTSCISTDFDEYVIEFLNVVPATNSVGFFMRMGTGGGPTYDTGANYGWVTNSYRAGAAAPTGADSGATAIQLAYNATISNSASWGVVGSLRLFKPSDTTLYKRVSGTIDILEASPFIIGNSVAAAYRSATAVTAFQFYFGSGNIASGDIRVYGVPKAAGASGNAGMVLLEQHTASSSATLDFTGFISSAYDTYMFEMVNVIPATNSVDFRMRCSTDGGSTYDSGANYRGGTLRWHSGPGGPGVTASGTSAIDLYGGDHAGSTTAWGGVNGSAKLYNPLSASYYKNVNGEFSAPDGTNAVLETQAVGGQYVSTTAVNAVRFLFSSGNIASGIIRVYGIPK